MKSNPRNWAVMNGLVTATLLAIPAAPAAQGTGFSRDGSSPHAVSTATPGDLAASAGARSKTPSLAPMAVTQIDDGHRSAPPSHAVPTAGAGPQMPALPPLAVSQIDDGRRSEALSQTLSLSFAEPIAIRQLLLLLVRDTNLSVVLDPDVEGTFEGELNDVTLRQALDLILEPHGLTGTLSENVVRVRRQQAETRIFNVNHVATRRSGSRSIGATNAVGGAYGQAVHAPGFPAGSHASVSGTDSGDAFEELRAGVTTLLSESGRLNVDRKAGLLQVTDFPNRLDRIAVYVEAYEARTLRQVRIAARILEVELREDFSAGIDWPLVLKSAGDAVVLRQRVSQASASGAFTIGVQVRDFKGLLDAFARQGRVNVMASPSVVAMNNEPAMMRVGTQDVFFVTTSQIDAASGRILQTFVAPQAITEGVVLSVTPQIAADGIINMNILPSVTERVGTATSRLGDQVPIVSVREADTLVRVHEGDTIVIAGLMQDRSPVETSKVTARGSGPQAAGPLRRGDPPMRKTDLVILLTPTVMTRDEITAAAAAAVHPPYQEPPKPARQ